MTAEEIRDAAWAARATLAAAPRTGPPTARLATILGAMLERDRLCAAWNDLPAADRVRFVPTNDGRNMAVTDSRQCPASDAWGALSTLADECAAAATAWGAAMRQPRTEALASATEDRDEWGFPPAVLLY